MASDKNLNNIDPQNITQINSPEIEMAKQKSSNTLLYLTLGVIALALVFLAYFYLFTPSSKQTAIVNQTESKNETNTSASSSDQQLNNDAGVIDKSLDNLNTQVNDIDKGLNDQSENLE